MVCLPPVQSVITLLSPFRAVACFLLPVVDVHTYLLLIAFTDVFEAEVRAAGASDASANFTDHADILSTSTSDLQRLARLSLSDVTVLQKTTARSILSKPPVTALDLYNDSTSTQHQGKYLTTGCHALDKFLRGGILVQGLTELAGESASGKTQLCLQLCLTVQLPQCMAGLQAGAVYVSTEDAFPNRRLMQMVALLKQRCQLSEVTAIKFTDNIFVHHVADVAELQCCIGKLPALLARHRVRLLVIDSIAALFRSEYGMHDAVVRAKELSAVAARLHHLAAKYGLAVICVNQISDIVGRLADGVCATATSELGVTPCLGLSWAKMLTTRLLMSRTDRQLTVTTDDKRQLDVVVRTLRVVFAPHLSNTICHYIIDNEGVKVLS